MTIDERLEKLTERHEAMARQFELWQIENQKRQAWVTDTLVRIEGNVLDNTTQIARNTAPIARNTAAIARNAEAISKLTATVQALAGTVERYITAQGNGRN
ncbi:MAG TPA: hypothetical protein VMT20_17565 [Terriglobia bacterium]|nr:hypothetical protein [Terriglobia bacterium]